MSIYGKNVVPIGGTGRPYSPGQRIVHECQDRLGALLFDWLKSIDEVIAEDLFGLANDARDRLAQTRYLDLRSTIKTRWTELTFAFRQAYHRDPHQDAPVSLEINDFSGLELVDDEKLSENILVREFSARLAEACNDELYGLDHRMATLLDIEDVDKINNPLGPTRICQALAESLSPLDSDTETRILLLRHLERHLQPALSNIYHEINQYLIGLSVLPELKRSYRRANTPSAPAQEIPPLQANPKAAIPVEGDVFNALKRLVAARAVETAAFPASSAPAGLILNGSPIGTGPASDGNACDPANLSRAFFASLEQYKPVPGEAMVNHIHAIRSSEAASQVGHLEAVTIDIVAMLFDFIFNDKDIPNGVKALVGRLQIPVLKVAMLDQSFFGNRNHPARRFLDEISEISLRWGVNIDEQDPFYITLAHLIERIQNEFEGDIEVFSRVLEELHSFVDNHENEEEATLKVATDIATQRQREAESWEQANHAVKLALTESLPAVIREFFQKEWVQALQKIAFSEEKDSLQWMDAVKLMSDLGQSVLPKKKPEERMALISALPNLLTRINRGLDLANPDKAARRPFFDALVALHTAALKGEPLATPRPLLKSPPAAIAETEKPAATVTQPEGDLVVTRSVSNGVEVEEVTLVGAQPVWRADDRDVARQVAGLKRGDWVEFRQEDDSASRERLTWISPQRHILVFSNHRAAKAISIAPDALARLIREGKALIVSDTPLFERAMSGVLDSLNAAA